MQQFDFFNQEEEIYQIIDQDNFTAEKVMFYVHQCCFQNIQKEAQKNNLEIIPNFQVPAYQIRTTPFTVRDSSVQIQDIRLRLSCQKIIFYKANSPDEAELKFSILEDHKYYELMLKYVQCQRITATYSKKINFNLFPDNYLMLVSEVAEQQNYIVFVLENSLDLDREVLERKVDEFMSTINFQTKQEVIELDKDLTQSPLFRKYINDLQTKFKLIEIKVVDNEQVTKLRLTGRTFPQQYSELEKKFLELKEKIKQLKNMDIENSLIWQLTQGGTTFLCNANMLVFEIQDSVPLREAYYKKRFSKENIKIQVDVNNIQFYLMGQRKEIKNLRQMVLEEVKNLEYVNKNIIYNQNFQVQQFLLDGQKINYFENLMNSKFSKELISFKIRAVQSKSNVNGLKINIEILYNSLNIQLENSLSQVAKLFNDLSTIEFNVQFYRFTSNFQKFCQTKNLIIKKIINKDIVLGQSAQIDELNLMYVQYQEKIRDSQLLQKQSTTITIENRLIYMVIKTKATQHSLGLSEKCALIFPQNTNLIIIYCYNISLINESVAIIKKYSDQLMKKICKKELLNQDQKILEYLRNDCQQELKKIEEEKVCQISLGRIQNQNTGKEEIIISYNEKKLILKSGNQTQQDCDLVVLQTKNFTCLRDQDLGLAKQKVIQMFGNDYVKHCITNVSELEIDEISVYPNQRNKKNIINIVIPTYKFGDNLQVSKEIIERNIKKVFELGGQMNSKSISLTIQGSGACNNAFRYLSETFLINLIDGLFSTQNSILTVYIFEQYEPRFEELKNITQMLVYPLRQRQIKFQWLADQQKYDELINSQIDEAYEIYQTDQNQQKFKIEYSYLQFEKTHQINLINKNILDLKTNATEQFQVNEFQGRKIYSLGPNLLDDRFINYLNLQELENELVFEMCLTQHFVIFEKFVYKEMVGDVIKSFVFKSPLKFESQQRNNHALLKLDFEWNEQNYITETERNINSIEIQTFDMVTQQSVLDSLNQLINEHIITFIYQVPNLFDEEINNLKRVILASAISINNQIEGGQQIKIKIQQRELHQLQQNLIIFTENQKVYPALWVPQKNIVEKILLDPKSQEYQDIVRHFKETDNGQIYQIKRIQNKILWENYSNETYKLTKYHQRQGYNMSNQEQKRYVWHGVRSQHPKIIYEGMKEGFNCAYSANGMWGPGIYFAQNARYSRDYSYQLKQEEGPQHQGRLIMLYCLLTTGKIENRDPDSSIRLPSDGFDCVSGVTNGSTVFILYAMDIRRAYPAYEIIYS